METEKWHLKKEVNASIIISIVGVAVAIITGYSELKKDIELIKADILVLHSITGRTTLELKEDRQIMRESLTVLNAKIDRLIERSK